MRIQEALAALDRLVPNAYENEEKLAWLNEFDAMLYRDVFAEHLPLPEPFPGYTAQTPLDTELLLPQAYSQMYLWLMEMKLCELNGELRRANNAAAKLNAGLSAFRNWYHRMHLPRQDAPCFRL